MDSFPQPWQQAGAGPQYHNGIDPLGFNGDASEVPTPRLVVHQQPDTGKATGSGGGAKNKGPLDPPPFVKMENAHLLDTQSPYMFVRAHVERVTEDGQGETAEQARRTGSLLAGTNVSSLHKLKDSDNKDGAWAVFPDLFVKEAGTYRLLFRLMQFEQGEGPDMGSWIMVDQTYSRPFKVVNGKEFPGMRESTFLTRSFADQGIKVRLRKDSKAQTTKKRNLQVAEKSNQVRKHQGMETDEDDFEAEKRQRMLPSTSHPYGDSFPAMAGNYPSVPTSLAPSGYSPFYNGNGQQHYSAPLPMRSAFPYPPPLNTNTQRIPSMDLAPSFTSPVEHHSPGSYPPPSASYQLPSNTNYQIDTSFTGGTQLPSFSRFQENNASPRANHIGTPRHIPTPVPSVPSDSSTDNGYSSPTQAGPPIGLPAAAFGGHSYAPFSGSPYQSHGGPSPGYHHQHAGQMAPLLYGQGDHYRQHAGSRPQSHHQ